MQNNNFRFITEGVTHFVAGPVYGKQDLGYSPGGAMDCFSMQTGNLLLGNPPDTECLEIVLLPPKIEFLDDMMFILCGAAREAFLISGENRRELNHAQVYQAQKGDILEFGELRYGFRTYLCFRNGVQIDIMGRVRRPFTEMAKWVARDSRIRLLRAPEHRHLKNPGDVLEGIWTISPQSNEVGIRLIGPPVSCDVTNIVSEAVSDGTMQLTASGPIILLKHRPTLGGYPRIFNVISADVDMLAQYAPGATMSFSEVTLEEAISINKQKQKDLTDLAKEYRVPMDPAITG